MQIMAIEFARNVLGYEKADSAEMDLTTPYPVISLMEDQKDVSDKGGTMRLGNWKCELTPNSKIEKIENNFVKEIVVYALLGLGIFFFIMQL